MPERRYHHRMRRRIVTGLACFAGAASLLVVSSSLPALAGTLRISEVKVPAPGGAPASTAIGSDGAAWFTESANSSVGRLGANGFSIFSLPGFTLPGSIISGPDGALWVADDLNSVIWRVTTAGKISVLPIPACTGCQYSGGSGIGNLTRGPDGAVWYSRPGNNSIGRITTTGHVHEFSVRGAPSAPGWLTTGPDGALWFTDSSGVARMTTTGSLSQVWSGLNYPSSITTGPDGNLWITGAYEDVVVRLTRNRVATVFPIATNCYTSSITSGGGALWVSCNNLDLVYKVTTAGARTALTVPSGSTENSNIVRAANGDEWFAETAVGRLAKIAG